MTKAKKILFLGSIGLTSLLWQSTMLGIVKPLDTISSKRNCQVWRSAAKLRSSHGLEWAAHHSAALGVFSALQRKEYKMEPLEIKNKLERTRELVKGLAVAKKEIAMNLAAFKGLSLAAIKMMLAGEELFDQDFVEHLTEKEGMLEDVFVKKSVEEIFVANLGETNQRVEATESEPDEVIEEAVADTETTKEADVTENEGFKEYVKLSVQEIEKIMDGWQPRLQERVLAILQDGQPRRRTEYEIEMARDEAQGNLIDLISESSYPAQTKLYKMLTDFIKDSRGELTEAA